jgi:hypothetical protein
MKLSKNKKHHRRQILTEMGIFTVLAGGLIHFLGAGTTGTWGTILFYAVIALYSFSGAVAVYSCYYILKNYTDLLDF